MLNAYIKEDRSRPFTKVVQLDELINKLCYIRIPPEDIMLFFSIVLIASSICFADARSAAPPASTCASLLPSMNAHGTPQTSQVPYEIDLTQFEDENGTYVYTPGMTYTLTFSGVNGEMFRGFFVQSRLASDSTTRVGTFAAIQERTRLSLCERPEDGVTHTHPAGDIANFTSRIMNWTAPSSGTGPIRFAFAVVETRRNFWADQRSDMVMEAGNQDDSASALFVSMASLLLACVGAILL